MPNYLEYLKYADKEGEPLYKDGKSGGKFPENHPWAVPNAIYLLLELYEAQGRTDFGNEIKELRKSIEKRVEALASSGESAFSLTESIIEELIRISEDKRRTPNGDYEHMLAALALLLHSFEKNMLLPSPDEELSADALEQTAMKIGLVELIEKTDSIRVSLMSGLGQAVSIRAVFPYDYIPPAIPSLRYEEYLAVALNTEGSIEIQVRAIFREYTRGPNRTLGKEISGFLSSLLSGEKNLLQVIDEIKGTDAAPGLATRVAPGKEFQHALVAIYLLSMVHCFYDKDVPMMSIDRHLTGATTLAGKLQIAVSEIFVFIPGKMTKADRILEGNWQITEAADILVETESLGRAQAPVLRLASGKDASAPSAAGSPSAPATAAGGAGIGASAAASTTPPDSRRKSLMSPDRFKAGLLNRQASGRAAFVAAAPRTARAGARGVAAPGTKR